MLNIWRSHMKRKSYGKLLSLLALLALLAIPLESLYSQHLKNLASGKIRNAGTIRFIEDAGTFDNVASATSDDAISNSSGTIEFTADMGARYDIFTGAGALGAALIAENRAKKVQK